MLSGVWAVVLALAEHACAADNAPVELSFTAPPGCPQRADVLRAIQAQLPEDFHSTTQLRARAEVIARSPSEFELILEFSSASGAYDARRVSSESCAAAADATALLLALALVPSSKPAPVQPPAAASVSHNEIGLLALVDSALMPSIAFGGGLRLGVTLGAWHLQLSAAQWAMQEAMHGPVRVQLDYWAVDLGLCYLASWGWLQAGPCARFELGRMGGYANNVEASRAGGARLQTASLSAETRIRLVSPLWLILDVGFEWILRRPYFEVADLGVVHRPDQFGLRVAFGPGLIW